MRNRLAWSEEWRSVVADTLESLGVAAWEWRADEDRLWWSENFGLLVGRERGYVPANIGEAFSLFEEDMGRPAGTDDLLSFLGGRPGPIEVERRAILPDGSTRWTLQRYSAILDDGGEAVGVFGLVIDIDERKRREREETLLHESARLLSKSLAVDDTLATIASLCVPAVANWCIVELVEGDGLRTVVNLHADPEKSRSVRTIEMQHPQAMPSAAGASHVVRSGEPALYDRIGDDLLERLAAGDRAALECLRQIGPRSMMIVPLKVRGEALGAVSLVSTDSTARFDERGLAFAERLVAQMAVALDNAQLHREADMRRAILARLHDVTAQLSRANSVEEVARATVEGALDVSGATGGALVWRGERNVPRVIAYRGFDDATIDEWERQVDDGAGPVAAVLSDGAPRSFARPQEIEEQYPGRWSTSGSGSWSFLPVRARGGVAGTVALSYDETIEVGSSLRESLRSLAEQAGVAMDRAHLLAHHRRVAATLQAGLQPPELPEIPGIESASVYLPAGSVDAGGDWYDLFARDDGSVVAIIGDVVGHGIQAVSNMARLRHTLAAHLYAGHGPADALLAVNELVFGMIDDEQRMATVAIVVVDRDRRRAVTARAGHPPIIVRQGADTRLLDIGDDVPIGVVPNATWHEEHLEVAPGAMFVMYTDGWIDYPGSDPAQLLDAIVGFTRNAPSPGSLLDEMKSRISDRHTDDAAALAISVR